MAGQPPHVTVLVPVRDRRERMLRCLDALLALDYPAFDVVVIDNNSRDGTGEACRLRAATSALSVRVITVAGSVGKARNEGVRVAAGEVVAFTDSDCIPAHDWLTQGAVPFADRCVGVVSGTTLPEDPPPYGPWPATQRITEQSWRFEACNAFYRRAALVDAGGFEEGISMWEDTAAGWAVIRLGWRAEFAPAAIVRHDVTYPGRSWHMRRVMRYGEGAELLKRYPEMADRLLWHHWFLAPRDAALSACLVGLAGAIWRRELILIALPYAAMRRPRAISRSALLGAAETVAFDLASLAGALRGSVRGRRLVL